MPLYLNIEINLINTSFSGQSMKLLYHVVTPTDVPPVSWRKPRGKSTTYDNEIKLQVTNTGKW